MDTLNKNKIFISVALTILILSISSIANAEITLNPDVFVIETGKKILFDIDGGNNLYVATVGDKTVAQVSISGNQGTIDGLSGGKTTITVEDTDGEKTNALLYVNDLELSQAQIFSKEGEIITVSIQSGSGSYNTDVADATIASAYISNDEIDIEALSIGTTKITVTDTDGNLATILITVEQGIKKTLCLLPGESKTVQLPGVSGFYNTTLSDTDIAAVTITNDDAQVVGLASGITDVIITDSDGVNSTIIVTVKLPAPEVTEIMEDDNLTISWDAITGADGYTLLFLPLDADGNSDINNLQTFALDNVNSVGPISTTNLTGNIALQAIETTIPEITSDISKIIPINAN